MDFSRHSKAIPILGIVAAAALFANYRIAQNAEDTAAIASRAVEDLLLVEAVKACEAAEHVVPFKYRSGKKAAVAGLRQQTNIADGRPMVFLRLYADGLICDYHPLGKRAYVGTDP